MMTPEARQGDSSDFLRAAHEWERQRLGDLWQGELDPRRVQFIHALSRIPELQLLPDTEEGIRKWNEENPREAKLLESSIDRLIEVFGLNISPPGDDSDEFYPCKGLNP